LRRRLGYYDGDEDGRYCAVYPDGVKGDVLVRPSSIVLGAIGTRRYDSLRAGPGKGRSLSPEEICVLFETSGTGLTGTNPVSVLVSVGDRK